LVKPHYFSENIMLGPRQRANPHDELTATMSTLIIKAHVKDGVDLALKHRLNPTIVDVINQHHGTSIVSFFYSRGRQHDKDVARGSQIMKMRSEEDADGTSEEQYRYDGPKPQFKECAIVSLADAVESAARALSRPTPNRIDQIVETILKGRIADGQLDECGLTLGEIDAIGDSFRATLPQMMHGRIRYGAEPDTEEDRSQREPRPTSPGPPRGS